MLSGIPRDYCPRETDDAPIERMTATRTTAKREGRCRLDTSRNMTVGTVARCLARQPRLLRQPIDHRLRDQDDALFGPAESLRVQRRIVADHETWGDHHASIDDHVA